MNTTLKKIIFIILTVFITSFAQAQNITVEPKEKFDKEATKKLISQGNSSIEGVTFARQGTKMSVLNMSKKYVAPIGTAVILIPYTDYFKEWLELSKNYQSQGKILSLPNEARECILVTHTTDNKGHFEFKTLMPGQYYIFADFSYTVSGEREYVTGYTDTYINNQYVNSAPSGIAFQHFMYQQGAKPKKIVTIKNNGDIENISLKDIRGGY